VYILGIVEGHNSSAALLKDGKIVAVCFEERLSRLKNDFGYPARAIQFCLAFENISAEEIDHVALVTEKLPLAQVAVKREATFSVKDYLREQTDYWKPKLIEGKDVDYLDLFKDKLNWDDFPYEISTKEFDRTSFVEFKNIRIETIKNKLSKTDKQIHILNHHLAHSMYAIFTYPKCYEKDLLVLVSDGYGDDCSSSVGTFKNNVFEFVSKSVGSGIGRIYRYATLLLKMRPGVDEFKVMGLAPYAKEFHSRPVYNQLKPYLEVDGMEILYTNPDKDIYHSLKQRLLSSRFDGIAGGLQEFCEDITKKWVTNCVKETGISSVVASGGVSMNIKINKAVMELPDVEDLFVGPSGGDESLSVGAAYALWHQLFPDQKIKPLEDTYLGPSYNKPDVKLILEKQLPSEHTVIEDPSTDLVAELLADFKVIARAVGRMEYGARSLGNRSILARASDADMTRKINDKIKRRDFWMPFAPLILHERRKDYLINPKDLDSPYMTIGMDSTELAKSHLKAALHPADDTLRPQLLEQKHNPKLYDLVKAFEQKTGIGGLLNTSFNLHGEPICCSPQESIKTFLNSDLDALLLDGYLIIRN
jgi:carbamoyltransferase